MPIQISPFVSSVIERTRLLLRLLELYPLVLKVLKTLDSISKKLTPASVVPTQRVSVESMNRVVMDVLGGFR